MKVQGRELMTSEFECGSQVLGILEVVLNDNSGGHDLGLAGVCQQYHMGVTGHNNHTLSYIVYHIITCESHMYLPIRGGNMWPHCL